MEVVESTASSSSSSSPVRDTKPWGQAPHGSGRGQRQRRRLQEVLEQWQRAALELLKEADLGPTREGDVKAEDEEEGDRDGASLQRSPSVSGDSETDEVDSLCNLIKYRVESPTFLEKLGSIHTSTCPSTSEETTTWDIVTDSDLWEETDSDQDGFVLVRQEDIAEGIACFMAAYLLSLKETKDVTPDQLKKALTKTISVKKKKGKLRKAWDGSKVIYNVASWSATVIGIYQNPPIMRAASSAFWTSCRLISKML